MTPEAARRVLHVTQPTDGGVAIYVQRLARSQIDQGWSVSVACPPGELSGDLDRLGINRLEWRANRSPGPSVPAETRLLAGIIERERPDLVHLHSSKAGLAGRWGPRRAPRIFQPHGWSWDAVGPLTGAAVRTWERIAAKRCDLLVCVSEEERSRGQEAGLDAHWAVIENAVELDAFPARDDFDRKKARDELELPNGPLVVCVGPLRYQKGQDLLLEAWPSVRSRVPSAGLVLVGAGAERENLETMAGAGVFFVGHQSDVLPWLTAADVVTIPSRWDGLSLALLEAMSSARSVVATETPGVGRVLNGGGRVVPTGDVASLADALVERLEDPALVAAEGARGRRHIEENFDWRRVMRQMNDAYERLLAAQP